MENGAPGNLGPTVVRSAGMVLEQGKGHVATQLQHLVARHALAPAQNHQYAIPMSVMVSLNVERILLTSSFNFSLS